MNTDSIKRHLSSAIASAIEWFQTPYGIGIVSVIAIAYGGIIAPRLPASIAVLFESPVFKLVFVSLILGVRHISPPIALALALGFVVSIQTLHRYTTFARANLIRSHGYAVPPPKEYDQVISEARHQPEL